MNDSCYTNDDVDMEPKDNFFNPNPLVDARKQEIHEKLEEYFYHNDRVYEDLGLDDDDLDMMEDYLELNHRDGFFDLKDEEFEEQRCELLRIPYSSPKRITKEIFLVTRHKVVPEKSTQLWNS